MLQGRPGIVTKVSQLQIGFLFNFETLLWLTDGF